MNLITPSLEKETTLADPILYSLKEKRGKNGKHYDTHQRNFKNDKGTL